VMFDTGNERASQTFSGTTLAGVARTFQGATVLALDRKGEVSVRQRGANGKLGALTKLPGRVLDMQWHWDGLLVATAPDAKTVQVQLFSPVYEPLGEVKLPAPKSLAVTGLYPKTALVAEETAEGTVAKLYDTGDGMKLQRTVTLSKTPMRVAGAGFGGSTEGTFVLLDDGKGGSWLARFPPKSGEVLLRSLAKLNGAKALALTTGYQRVYVAWTVNGRLYLSRVDGQFK